MIVDIVDDLNAKVENVVVHVAFYSVILNFNWQLVFELFFLFLTLIFFLASTNHKLMLIVTDRCH